MGRLTDAYKVLVGRTDLDSLRSRAHVKLARIEAEWCEILQVIERAMRTIQLDNDALRKREERAAKRAAKATPAQPAQVSPPSSASPKEALKARLRAEGRLGRPVAHVIRDSGSDGDSEGRGV